MTKNIKINAFCLFYGKFVYFPKEQQTYKGVLKLINMWGGKMSSLRVYDKEEWEAIEDVARMLREHVKDENYSYVDKLANAFNSYVAEVSLEEALRAARSKGTWIASEKHVKDVIKLLREDLGTARVIAALALAIPSKIEGE